MKKLITLIAVVLFSATAFAQIPNSNFESWDTFATYKSPKGWDNLDSVINLVPGGAFTCERDSPSFGGNYCMKLISKTVVGFGVAPGVAVSGKIDYTSYAAKSGFPFTSRPQSLTGQYQYMVFGSSFGFIMVYLSKWNTATSKRDTVAFVNKTLTGMEMSWKAFSIDLKYYSGVNPDSAIIVLSASGATPANNDYLYIDTLGFNGSVPVGTVTLDAANIKEHHSAMNVYPNPSQGYTNIAFFSGKESNLKITINDLNGRVVKTLQTRLTQGDNNIPVTTSGIAPGVYFIKAVTEQAAEEQKLIIE